MNLARTAAAAGCAAAMLTLAAANANAAATDESGFWAALQDVNAATQTMVATGAYYAEVAVTASGAVDGGNKGNTTDYYLYADGSFRATTTFGSSNGQGDTAVSTGSLERSAMCLKPTVVKKKVGKKTTKVKAQPCWVKDTSIDSQWHPIDRSLINVTVSPYVLDRDAFAAQFARRPSKQASFGVYRDSGGMSVTSYIESEPQRPDLKRAGNWMRFQTDAALNRVSGAGEPSYQKVSMFLNDVNWQDPDGVLHKVESQTTTLRLNSDPVTKPYPSDTGARQSAPFAITVNYLMFGQ